MEPALGQKQHHRKGANDIERCGSCAGCSPQGTDSSLATALSVLTQALPDQATKQEVHSPATQSPISPSSPSSSAFWRRSARKGASPAARAGNQDESSAARAGNQDESSAARAGGTAWQAAAENVGLHALVLSHMCQQGRDAQTEPDKADDPVSCSYGDLGSTQARVLVKTAYLHQCTFLHLKVCKVKRRESISCLCSCVWVRSS